MAEAEVKEHRIPLQCRDCKAEWQEAVTLPMNVEAFLARGKGWGVCPKCGGKQVDMLSKPPNPFYVPDKQQK